MNNHLTPAKMLWIGIGFIALGIAIYVTSTFPASRPIEASSSVPAQGWKTYKDTIYGFEVMYPESYSIVRIASTSTDTRSPSIAFESTEDCKPLQSGHEW